MCSAPAAGHVSFAYSARFAIHWLLLWCDVGVLHFVTNCDNVSRIGRRLRHDVGTLCFVMNCRCLEGGSVVTWGLCAS